MEFFYHVSDHRCVSPFELFCVLKCVVVYHLCSSIVECDVMINFVNVTLMQETKL